MKKFLIISFALVVCCSILGAILIYGFAGSYIDKRAKEVCSTAYGTAPEFLEKTSVSLFPPTVNFGKFRWNVDAPGMTINAEAKNVKVELEWAPLLSGETRFREILIESPNVALSPANREPRTLAKSRAEAKASPIFIERLVVRDGELKFDNSGRRYMMKDIKVVATNVDTSKGADLKGDFILSLEAGDSEKLEGNLAFKGAASYYRPNLTLRKLSVTFTALDQGPLSSFSPIKLNLDGACNLEKGGARLTEATVSAPQINLRAKGELAPDLKSFEGECRAVIDLARLDKDFNLAFPEMETALSSPVVFRYPNLNLPAFALRAGDTQGEGKLRVKLPQDNSPLSIVGELTCGVIRLGPFPAPEESGGEVAKRRKTSKTEKDASPGGANPPEINFAFKATGLDYEKLNLKNISFNIKGKNGDYSIPDLKFQWEGGAIDAALKLNTPDFLWNFNGSGKNINFGKMLDRFGIDGFEKGSASFQAKLDATGAVPRQIAASLSGEGKFAISGLRVKILEEIARTLTFFSRDRINSVGVGVDAPFVAKDGVVNFAGLKASSSAVSADGSVSINFVKNMLDSAIRFRVGGLTIPLKIGGAFDHISVGLDE